MPPATAAAANYNLMAAVDVLDQLAAGVMPPPPALLRGALVLAFHTTPADETPVLVVEDLERLVLTSGSLDDAGRERCAFVASALRRHIGVH